MLEKAVDVTARQPVADMLCRYAALRSNFAGNAVCCRMNLTASPERQITRQVCHVGFGQSAREQPPMQGYSRGIAAAQQGCSRGTYRGTAGVQQGYSRGAAGVQQGYSRGTAGVQQGCSRGAAGVQQGCSRGTAGVQQGCRRGTALQASRSKLTHEG